MHYSSYYDDDDEILTYPRPMTPDWYRNGNRTACAHFAAGVQPKMIREHQGYSDFLYWEWMCPECSHTWVTGMEG